jgi:hypothetical protein
MQSASGLCRPVLRLFDIFLVLRKAERILLDDRKLGKCCYSIMLRRGDQVPLAKVNLALMALAGIT